MQNSGKKLLTQALLIRKICHFCTLGHPTLQMVVDDVQDAQLLSVIVLLVSRDSEIAHIRHENTLPDVDSRR